MKKILIIILSLVMVLSLVGCVSEEEQAQYEKQQAIDKGSKALSENLKNTANIIAKNQNVLETKLPIPEMDYSNNRANIIKKLNTFGKDPNKVSFIYCFTPSGQLILFASVKGCVTNLSAYAVPDDQIIDHTTSVNVPNSSQVVQSPDADGTYGTNGEGIYWFDTEGIYHEWNGLYMVVDQSVKLNVQPMMVMNVENK